MEHPEIRSSDSGESFVEEAEDIDDLGAGTLIPVEDFSQADQDAKNAEVHSQESCDEIQNASLPRRHRIPGK